MRLLRRVMFTVITACLAFFAALAGLSLMSTRPADLGLVNGRLRDCPPSPNCVCTQASSADHRISPIPMGELSADEAMTRLKRILSGLPRVRIITADERYLHAEFTSLLFRFVDDVEFLIDEDRREVHFRSASRVGYSDLGANRARMEQLRRLFTSF